MYGRSLSDHRPRLCSMPGRSTSGVHPQRGGGGGLVLALDGEACAAGADSISLLRQVKVKGWDGGRHRPAFCSSSLMRGK